MNNSVFFLLSAFQFIFDTNGNSSLCFMLLTFFNVVSFANFRRPRTSDHVRVYRFVTSNASSEENATQ